MFFKCSKISLIFVLFLQTASTWDPFGGADLGSQISANVQRSLAPLQNLGDQIKRQVYESLKPVREMANRSKMKVGYGGKTMVKYYPSGTSLLCIRGECFTCSEEIKDYQCKGTKAQYEPKTIQDFCFAQSYSQVNDYICISNGDGMSINCINGKCSCTSYDGKVFMAKRSEFEAACKDNSAEYWWSGSGIQTNEVGSHVDCTQNDSTTSCHFKENSPLLN